MTDYLARPLFQDLIQGIWAIILATLFLYTFKIYKKRYLKLWSWSWWAFSFYMLSRSVIHYTSWRYTLSAPLDILSSSVSLFAAYTQVSLLLLGCWSLIVNKKFYNAHVRKTLATAGTLSILTSVLFYTDDTLKTFTRSGIWALITGLAFLFVGIWMVKNRDKHKSIGESLLIMAFLVDGVEQLHAFTVMLLPVLGMDFNLYYVKYLGLLDFFIEALIGMGMAIWLLEYERKDLEKAYTDLDTFFYSTSHDLKSPLASIIGLIDLGKIQIKDIEALEYFQQIENRVTKLDAVISDILAYARSAKHKLKIDLLNFNTIINDIKTSLEFNDGANRVKLIYEENEDNTFYSDKIKINTIFHNLISNAIKYHDGTKESSYVKISFQKEDNHISIKIKDNGIGIPKSAQKRVFEMFYRASASSTGSGLGLYIVQEAVKKLNGTIRVKSTRGQGTTFTVRLPLSKG